MEMPGDNSQQILGRRQLERRYDTTIPVSFIIYIYFASRRWVWMGKAHDPYLQSDSCMI